jgi:hypothetical protein
MPERAKLGVTVTAMPVAATPCEASFGRVLIRMFLNSLNALRERKNLELV